MDELFIGEKKYISSRQAAKITGYAKDYVGQLCREGRVPARLVGRSWYVLESAVKDHRFGTTEEKSSEARTVESVPVVTEEKKLSPPEEYLELESFERPRYEALPADTFPPLNRLRALETPSVTTQSQIHEESLTSANELHDSWKKWFDPEKVIEEEPVKINRQYESGPSKDSEHTDGHFEEVGNLVADQPSITVPIHVRLRPQPTVTIEHSKPEEMSTQELSSDRQPWRIVRIIALIIALIFVFLLLLNSGYLDTYLLVSNGQFSTFSGLSTYTK